MRVDSVSKSVTKYRSLSILGTLNNYLYSVTSRFINIHLCIKVYHDKCLTLCNMLMLIIYNLINILNVFHGKCIDNSITVSISNSNSNKYSSLILKNMNITIIIKETNSTIIKMMSHYRLKSSNLFCTVGDQ